jgi:hypothetical protein
VQTKQSQADEQHLVLQRLVQRRSQTEFALSASQVLCGFCLILGYLGVLQSIPSVALMTTALRSSAGRLAELSVMVAVVMALFALLLRNGALADERMTTMSMLLGYIILGVLTGETLQESGPCLTSDGLMCSCVQPSWGTITVLH